MAPPLCCHAQECRTLRGHKSHKADDAQHLGVDARFEGILPRCGELPGKDCDDMYQIRSTSWCDCMSVPAVLWHVEAWLLSSCQSLISIVSSAWWYYKPAPVIIRVLWWMIHSLMGNTKLLMSPPILVLNSYVKIIAVRARQKWGVPAPDQKFVGAKTGRWLIWSAHILLDIVLKNIIIQN